MNRILFLIFLTFTVAAGKSQSLVPDFSADRPGMATPTNIMMPLKFQIESGFSFERSGSAGAKQDYILFNSSLLRFGIDKNAEIRLQTDVAQLKTDSVNLTGMNPLTLGVKLKIFGKSRSFLLPQASVLMNVTLPWLGKKEFRPVHPIPSVFLLMQNDITQKLNVCYNFGVQYDEESAAPVEFFALCFGYGFNDKFSAFIENYNYFASASGPVNSFDAGCAWMVAKNVQLDVSGNLNCQDFKHYFMLNCGVAWRILKKSGSKI